MLKKLITCGLSLCLATTLLTAKDLTNGKVLEIKDGGGYSYLKIETKDKKSIWAAVPGGAFKVGQEVSINEQMKTQNFRSKTLNQTFDTIIFGTIANAQNIDQTKVSKKDYMKAHQKKKVVYKGEVIKTSIKDLKENPTNYSNKVIEVQGKIVKVSRNIMNTNWVHIEDKEGNKLIFRSTEDRVMVGQEVMAKGMVHTNVDYGYGYKYDIIIVDTLFKSI